ncbi:MAG: transposase, partial [Nitrososphaerota archaeon]
SKRLKVIIDENIGWIINKYKLNDYQIKLITKISHSTIDRLIKGHRINKRKGIYCQTRPGSLLRREIPLIIEMADDINKPGHIQIDLIAHCGNSLLGEFLWTLNTTDIYSQWK